MPGEVWELGAAGRVEFRMLGRLEVTAAGSPVALGGLKQRARLLGQGGDRDLLLGHRLAAGEAVDELVLSDRGLLPPGLVVVGEVVGEQVMDQAWMVVVALLAREQPGGDPVHAG